MKHWVFDLDGTLVDSFSHYFRALDEIFASYGKTFSKAHYHDALTLTLDRLFAEHLPATAVAPALSRLQDESNNHALLIKTFDGIPEALELLKARGSRIAIWTNRDLDSASRIIKAAGLDRFVELCVSGTCVERKPSPAGLERIAREFDCVARDITMVGDHEHDVTTPKGAGARAIRASWHAYWEIKACAHAHEQFYTVSAFRTWLSRQSLAI